MLRYLLFMVYIMQLAEGQLLISLHRLADDIQQAENELDQLLEMLKDNCELKN